MSGRCPTDTCYTSTVGAYGAVRDHVDPKSGKRPVTHWAMDLRGTPRVTPVYAPEDGVVLDVATGQSSPWTGYDPGLVFIRGVSGVYHVLGHLDYATLRVQRGQTVKQGTPVGVMGINHTHWEVRRKPQPDWGLFPSRWQAHGANNMNPMEWLAAVNAPRLSGSVGIVALTSIVVAVGTWFGRALSSRVGGSR